MDDMLTSKQFLDELINHRIDFFCGVPDSVIRKLIELIPKTGIPYVSATCEDVAVGVCVGAYLAGKKPCLLMQNSGLGNASDTIITLNILYKIPFLFVISWRGFDGHDEVQHLDWGEITLPFLDTIGLPYMLISKDNCKENINKAMNMINNQNISVALIVRRGYLDEKR